MAKTRRRLRNENARLKAKVACLQAELKRLRVVGPWYELLSHSLPRVVREINKREAVGGVGPAIRKDPLGFWEVVPTEPIPPQKGDQILRERSYGTELREFNGEKWVTTKTYCKNGATDDRD